MPPELIVLFALLGVASMGVLVFAAHRAGFMSAAEVFASLKSELDDARAEQQRLAFELEKVRRERKEFAEEILHWQATAQKHAEQLTTLRVRQSFDARKAAVDLYNLRMRAERAEQREVSLTAELAHLWTKIETDERNSLAEAPNVRDTRPDRLTPTLQSPAGVS